MKNIAILIPIIQVLAILFLVVFAITNRSVSVYIPETREEIVKSLDRDIEIIVPIIETNWNYLPTTFTKEEALPIIDVFFEGMKVYLNATEGIGEYIYSGEKFYLMSARIEG